MIVYIVALAETALYLLAVPVHLAVRLDGLTAGAGVALFDGRAALRRAGAKREKRGGGPGLLPGGGPKPGPGPGGGGAVTRCHTGRKPVRTR